MSFIEKKIKKIKDILLKGKNRIFRNSLVYNLTGKKKLYEAFPYYLIYEEDRNYKINKKKIKIFQNLHKGKRCFIIGNGPSLNKIDLNKLNNEITFGVNGIFYKTDEIGFKPTYYVVEDKHVLYDNKDRINSYKVEGQKFFPSIYYHDIINKNNTTFFQMNTGFYDKRSPNFCVPRFSTDFCENVYCGQSVTIINLQIAYYMGFSEVYLIGMDFSYVIPKEFIIEGTTITSTNDDINHFHPEYFGKGKKWHDPKLDRVKNCYKLCKLIYEAKGRKIYNATFGGKLDIFERCDLNSLF